MKALPVVCYVVLVVLIQMTAEKKENSIKVYS